MLDKSLKYYLIKINRISGWILFFLVIIFIITGFAITGRYGFSKLIDPNLARKIHWVFTWPVIIMFIIHSCINIYFAFKRWGWIK